MIDGYLQDDVCAVVMSRSGLGGLVGELDDDGLDLGVVVDAVGPVLAPHAGLLVAAERHLRREHVVVVHPHRARAQTLPYKVKLVRGINGICEMVYSKLYITCIM